MPKRRRELVECPNCGEEFPAGRLACPECGSDAETGWKDAEEIDYQSIELPDDREPAPARSRVGWWVALVLALIGMIVAAVLR